MSAYILERYETLHLLFNFVWVVYVAILIILIGAIMCLYSNDKHKGGKKYYSIIFLISLFLIGLIGTILLPPPELVKVWLLWISKKSERLRQVVRRTTENLKDISDTIFLTTIIKSSTYSQKD